MNTIAGGSEDIYRNSIIKQSKSLGPKEFLQIKAELLDEADAESAQLDKSQISSNHKSIKSDTSSIFDEFQDSARGENYSHVFVDDVRI